VLPTKSQVNGVCNIDEIIKYEELTTKEINDKIEGYLKEFNELFGQLTAINIEINIAYIMN
jgi:hypothetical protein